MVRSVEELYQELEEMGFRDFKLRQYDQEMYSFLSVAVEDNAKAYLIDVVPSSLEHGENNGIALMEKHYYKKYNMDRLCQKWQEIILLFSCYYPLKSVFVTDLAFPEYVKFREHRPDENEDGYYLEVPQWAIEDLDSFASRVFKKAYGGMVFWFDSLDLVIGCERRDVYNVVTLKKITQENTAAIEILRRLVEAQGLFLV